MRRLVFTKHAALRMLKRRIGVQEVRHALAGGETIEEYSRAKPYPCRLVLGTCGGRRLHVVVAEDIASGTMIVVTVYEPDERRWDREYRRRR